MTLLALFFGFVGVVTAFKYTWWLDVLPWVACALCVVIAAAT